MSINFLLFSLGLVCCSIVIHVGSIYRSLIFSISSFSISAFLNVDYEFPTNFDMLYFYYHLVLKYVEMTGLVRLNWNINSFICYIAQTHFEAEIFSIPSIGIRDSHMNILISLKSNKILGSLLATRKISKNSQFSS